MIGYLERLLRDQTGPDIPSNMILRVPLTKLQRYSVYLMNAFPVLSNEPRFVR